MILLSISTLLPIFCCHSLVGAALRFEDLPTSNAFDFIGGSNAISDKSTNEVALSKPVIVDRGDGVKGEDDVLDDIDISIPLLSFNKSLIINRDSESPAFIIQNGKGVNVSSEILKTKGVVTNKQAPYQNKVQQFFVDMVGNAPSKARLEPGTEKYKYEKNEEKSVKKIDTIFIIDGSSSIGRSIFECGIEAMQNAAEVIDNQNTIAADGTRLGAIKFSNAPRTIVEFALGRYNSLEEVKNGLRLIKYEGGGTRVDKALAFARQHFVIKGRSGAEKVIIIMTDGKSKPYTASRQAKLLRNMGVEIFSVTVGVDVAMDKIKDMVSKPEDIHIIKSLNYCTFNSELMS